MTFVLCFCTDAFYAYIVCPSTNIFSCKLFVKYISVFSIPLSSCLHYLGDICDYDEVKCSRFSKEHDNPLNCAISYRRDKGKNINVFTS